MWLALTEAASAADLTLGALAGYRGYFDRIGRIELDEHLFEQELRAELETALLRRSLGAWSVGFALDHTLTLGPQDRARVLAYQYDTELGLWPDGELPVEVFASRQITGAAQSLVPGYQVLSDTYGYSAALRPSGLPRLETRGLFQRRRIEDRGVVRDERTSLVDGTLLHNDNRLLALARVQRRRDEDPLVDDRRDLDQADAFLEYRLDRDTSVVARARSRRFDSLVDGAPYLVDTLATDASVATRPTSELSGVTYCRVDEQTTDGDRSGTAAAGTTWTWYPTDELSAVGQAGVGDAWTVDVDGAHALIGQFANVSANHTRWRKEGGWQLFAQGGLASLVADSAEAGVQAGAASGGVLRRRVGPIQLAGGADLGRQWDTSSQDQSYVTWGWMAEAASRLPNGLQVQLQGTQAVIDQQVVDTGNSDRLQGTAVVVLRPEVQLDVAYGLDAHRDVLDGERSTGLGHALTLRAVPTERIQIYGLLQYSFSTATSLYTLWTRRAEGTVLYHLPIVDASARVTQLRSWGALPPVTNTIVWVELSRELGWDL